MVLYPYYNDSSVTKLLSYSALASFKIKFTHNCSCYNGNLLHLKYLALRNVTIKESEEGVWLPGSNGFRPEENQREINTGIPHGSLQPPKPADRLGSMAWKAPLLFHSRAFSTGDRVYAALAREKGKLSESMLILTSGCLQVSEMLNYETSFFSWIHIFLKKCFGNVFSLTLNIDCILMKTSILWFTIIQKG